MVATSKIILPYEPGYVANKEADKRRTGGSRRRRDSNNGLGAMTTAKPRPPLAPGETRAYPVLALRDIVVWIAWAINRGGECVRFMWQG